MLLLARIFPSPVFPVVSYQWYFPTDGLISGARKAGRIFEMANLTRQTPNCVFNVADLGTTTWCDLLWARFYRESNNLSEVMNLDFRSFNTAIGK